MGVVEEAELNADAYADLREVVLFICINVSNMI